MLSIMYITPPNIDVYTLLYYYITYIAVFNLRITFIIILSRIRSIFLFSNNVDNVNVTFAIFCTLWKFELISRTKKYIHVLTRWNITRSRYVIVVRHDDESWCDFRAPTRYRLCTIEGGQPGNRIRTKESECAIKRHARARAF